MKRVGILFLLFVLSLFYARPTFAQVGSGILITELMTASTSSASSEFIELYNQSSDAIDVTGWKVQYLSATGSSISTKTTLEGAISAHGFLMAATTEFQTEKLLVSDATLSSGLAGAGGRIRLVDVSNSAVDSVSYGASALSSEGTPAVAPAAGKSLKRIVDNDAQFVDDNNNSTDFTVSESPFAQGGGVEEVAPVVIDVCPATPEIDLAIPVGYELDQSGNCVVRPLESRALKITELLANAEGSDEENEFIEIYNPNDSPVGLDGYKLYVGPNYEKNFNFPAGLEISPHQYLAFHNDSIKFNLLNSSSRVKLVAPNNVTVSETDSYQNPGDGMSWSLFDDGWKMTESSTPDAENVYVVTSENDVTGSTTSSVLPCPAGKFRNPATNRCKNIDSSSSALQPCASDQYRSPETNRCRKLSSANTALVACKVGQERNPETNRCRKILSASSVLKPCQPGYERNPDTNRCRKSSAKASNALTESAAINPVSMSSRIVTLLIVLAIAYGLFEYRTDIGNFISRLRDKRGSPRPPG